jgi:hypothetical protein
LKKWTISDSRNTLSTTNLEEEGIVDAPGNDGNASMPEEVKRPNTWKIMMMMMMTFTVNSRMPKTMLKTTWTNTTLKTFEEAI